MTVCQCQLTTMISFKISGKLLLRPVEQVTRQQFLMELTPVTPSAGSAAVQKVWLRFFFSVDGFKSISSGSKMSYHNIITNLRVFAYRSWLVGWFNLIPLLDFDTSAMLESCGSMVIFIARGMNCHHITMVARRGKIVRGLKFVQQICGSLQ